VVQILARKNTWLVRSRVTGSNRTWIIDVFSQCFVTLRWTHSSPAWVGCRKCLLSGWICSRERWVWNKSVRYFDSSSFVEMPSFKLLCFWTLSSVLFLFKTVLFFVRAQRFGDWILSPSSGGNWVGRYGLAQSIGPYWVGFTWRQR
jgi:hypothetical protein